jgi:energy-coupling factor transport system ATP-binding protein
MTFQYPEDQIFEPTVMREVTFGLRHRGIPDAEMTAQAHHALEMVGLGPAKFASRAPLTLSGGEMRRVALASVLALRPKMLILDEPTAGLDPAGRRQILSGVRAWQEESGATLVIISHHLDELARIAERVVLLKEGSIVADSPTPRVLSDETLLAAAQLLPTSTVALLQALRTAGWSVRTDHLLPEEAVAEILRAREVRS